MHTNIRCSGGAQVVTVFAFLDLPEDLQRRVLVYVPLRQWAQLACMRKSLRATYSERVRERDVAVAARLRSDFRAESCEGLANAQTSLPHDLIVEPPVRRQSSATAARCITCTTMGKGGKEGGQGGGGRGGQTDCPRQAAGQMRSLASHDGHRVISPTLMLSYKSNVRSTRRGKCIASFVNIPRFLIHGGMCSPRVGCSS